MRIITKNGQYHNLTGGVYVTDKGVILKRHGIHFVPSGGGRTSSGKITGFSAAARRRLREALLTASMTDSSMVGVTLTLPWDVSDGEWETDAREPLEAFRDAWNAFGHAFRRRWQHSALIYRVELQQRGAPHIHAVVWFADIDLADINGGKCRIIGDVATREQLRWQLTDLWAAALGGRLPWTDGAWRGGFRSRGVSIDVLSTGGAIRYLCDHASKRKQSQLGYQGKQWGIVGRANFEWHKPAPLPLSDRAEVLFRRAVARMSRYTLSRGNHAKAPFGSHKSHPRSGNGVRYGVTAPIAYRLAEWAASIAN